MRCVLLFFLAALAARAVAPCQAGDSDASAPRFETYVGADYDGRAASLNSSSVWSVFSPVNQPGFRLKLDGLADVYGDTGASVFSNSFMAADLKDLGDIMAGYQFKYGPAWIKVYAGAAYQVQSRLIWQAGAVLGQKAWGAAAAIETYWQVKDRVWAVLDVSWLQPENATSFYSRAAYEFYRTGWGLKISGGAEASLSLNNAGDYGAGRALNVYDSYVRGGALLNLRYGRNDLSLSGGFAQASSDADARPYAAISYGRQF